jgi:hypothetical protein
MLTSTEFIRIRDLCEPLFTRLSRLEMYVDKYAKTMHDLAVRTAELRVRSAIAPIPVSEGLEIVDLFSKSLGAEAIEMGEVFQEFGADLLALLDGLRALMKIEDKPHARPG